jgi:hypothetical protein
MGKKIIGVKHLSFCCKVTVYIKMNPINLIQNYREKYSVMNVPRNLVMEISRFNMKRKITDEELSLILDKRIENLKEECAMWKEKNTVIEREIELYKAEERIAKYEKETFPGNWQPSKWNGKTIEEIEEEPEVKTKSYPCISCSIESCTCFTNWKTGMPCKCPCNSCPNVRLTIAYPMYG